MKGTGVVRVLCGGAVTAVTATEVDREIISKVLLLIILIHSPGQLGLTEEAGGPSSVSLTGRHLVTEMQAMKSFLLFIRLSYYTVTPPLPPPRTLLRPVIKARCTGGVLERNKVCWRRWRLNLWRWRDHDARLTCSSLRVRQLQDFPLRQ